MILVLNQKQREDDEVNMLIDRLRENGVSCLFMKNGNNNNASPKCESDLFYAELQNNLFIIF